MTATALDTLRQQLGDRYAIERQLGRGGMGAVYLARDRQLDRLLAIKVLPEEFATQRDPRERFLRETRTAAGFSHPNIVPRCRSSQEFEPTFHLRLPRPLRGVDAKRRRSASRRPNRSWSR